MSVEPNKSQTMDAAEPREGWSPMPVLLVGLLALLVFWGLTQLDDRGGGFDKLVYAPYTSTNDLSEAWPVNPEVERARTGKKLYEANCAPCHQANGVGSPAVNAPPLAGSDWVNTEGPHRMIRIVLNGLQGPLQVSGKQFGAGVMPPWRDTFKDDQIAAIITYVRGNKEWGNKAGGATPEQVKAIRDKTKDRAGAWTGDELMKVPLKD